MSVRATDLVAVTGATSDGKSFSTLVAKSMGTGDSGNIAIATNRLIVQDGADVSVSAFGEGRSGELSVRATSSVELTGARTSPDRQTFSRSGLFAATEGTKDGGDLTVITPRLLVTNGARVSVSTRGKGQNSSRGGRGGNLNILASDSVELSGSSADGQFTSGLFALSGEERPKIRANEATGDGGDLRIATNRLIVRDGAEVSVSAKGSGAAGNLEIQAHSLRLNNQGHISAETRAGDNGNIILDVSDIQMQRGSKITTNAQGTATGGNIIINADTLVALEDSDITANAQKGSGGRVTINAQGIFGTQFRPADTPQSDITATSDLGPQFSGTVSITTLGVDPSQGLVTMSEKPVDVTGLVASGCADRRLQGSEFIATGRGGLPPNPSEAISGEATWIDLRPRAVVGAGLADNHWGQQIAIGQNPPYKGQQGERNLPSIPNSQLVEAQGWVMNSKGQVVLVAQAPTPTPHNPRFTQKQCSVP